MQQLRKLIATKACQLRDSAPKQYVDVQIKYQDSDIRTKTRLVTKKEPTGLECVKKGRRRYLVGGPRDCKEWEMQYKTVYDTITET